MWAAAIFREQVAVSPYSTLTAIGIGPNQRYLYSGEGGGLAIIDTVEATGFQDALRVPIGPGVRPAEIIEETIAPEYETIEVQKLVSPARQERIEIPATYKTVERRIAIGGVAEWRPVLCETNTDATKIAEVQQALTDAGHPLAIDGIFGPATFAAMQAYQLEQGLAVGYLTVATVERLGVSPN